MQSGYIRVNLASVIKLLTITITISLSGCSVNLENPKLPDCISCQGSKCCYKISATGSTQICGAGSLNDLQFQVNHTNY